MQVAECLVSERASYARVEISAEAKLTRGFREGLHQEDGQYCIHRVDSIEHVGFDVKIFTGRHKGVINKASSEIRGGAQYNVALFTSALTKANSGQQSRLFLSKHCARQKIQETDSYLSIENFDLEPSEEKNL